MVVALRATLVLALVAESFALSIQRNRDIVSFASFISEYGRSYVTGTQEYEDRRKLFEIRIGEVKNHNSKPTRLWNAAINHLSDRTKSELVALRGLRPIRATKEVSTGAVSPQRQRGHFLHQLKNLVVPAERSWTNLTSLQADADQGACGSCWAVATATMLWANSEINGYSRTYSAQELVDCTPNPHRCGGSGGCQGSTTELAMNWVMENSLAASDETPYLGVDGTCNKASSGASLLAHNGDESLQQMIKIGFHSPLSMQSKGLELGLRGWERLPENEYEPLLRAVAFTGPVAVSVAADAWRNYGEGIFDDCGVDAVVDHAVTLIGYGIDATRGNAPYWLIKNSWGLYWGEGGNIRLFRQEGDSHCGTDHQPALGTACEGGPTNVRVCGMCGILYDSVVAHFNPAP